MSKSTVVTTAEVVCYINGKAIGRVTSFRWSSDTPKKVINGIDNPQPYELAPTNAICQGSVGILRTRGDGGIEALGMAAHSSQLTNEKYWTLTLIDRVTDTLLFRADYCSCTNQSWELAEKSIVRGTVNFSALSWSNECRPR